MECLGETVKIDTIREGYAFLSNPRSLTRSYVQWFVDDEYKPDKDYLFCLSRNYYVTLCKSKSSL